MTVYFPEYEVLETEIEDVKEYRTELTDDGIKRIYEVFKTFLLENEDQYKHKMRIHDIQPGEIGIFDERKKCKEFSFACYASRSKKYVFEWIGAENIWYDFWYRERTTEEIISWSFDHMKNNCPAFVHILECTSS